MNVTTDQMIADLQDADAALVTLAAKVAAFATAHRAVAGGLETRAREDLQNYASMTHLYTHLAHRLHDLGLGPVLDAVASPGGGHEDYVAWWAEQLHQRVP